MTSPPKPHGLTESPRPVAVLISTPRGRECDPIVGLVVTQMKVQKK